MLPEESAWKVRMATVGWRDVAYTRKPGSVRLREQTITITPEQVALWVSDPDGRFKLEPSADGQPTAKLGKFFPSL